MDAVGPLDDNIHVDGLRLEAAVQLRLQLTAQALRSGGGGKQAGTGREEEEGEGGGQWNRRRGGGEVGPAGRGLSLHTLGFSVWGHKNWCTKTSCLMINRLPINHS